MKCDKCTTEISKDSKLVVITIGTSGGERIQTFFCEKCANTIISYINRQITKSRK